MYFVSSLIFVSVSNYYFVNNNVESRNGIGTILGEFSQFVHIIFVNRNNVWESIKQIYKYYIDINCFIPSKNICVLWKYLIHWTFGLRFLVCQQKCRCQLSYVVSTTREQSQCQQVIIQNATCYAINKSKSIYCFFFGKKRKKEFKQQQQETTLVADYLMKHWKCFLSTNSFWWDLPNGTDHIKRPFYSFLFFSMYNTLGFHHRFVQMKKEKKSRANERAARNERNRRKKIKEKIRWNSEKRKKKKAIYKMFASRFTANCLAPVNIGIIG